MLKYTRMKLWGILPLGVLLSEATGDVFFVVSLSEDLT
jgi:hypothetical protein